MNKEENAKVVQYCSSLGQACGIATYTAMLCEGQNMPSIKNLEGLGDLQPKYLHVQHEFSIMPLKELRRVINFCQANNVKFYITMHSVALISPPSFSFILFELLIDVVSILAAQLEKIALMFDKYSGNRDFKLYNFFTNAKISIRRLVFKFSSRIPFASNKVKIDAALQKQIIFPGIFRLDWLFYLYRSEKLIMENADKIIVHSDLSKQAILLMGARRVEVVDHAVKEFATSPHLSSKSDGKLHVGFFGFFSPYKMLPEVINACKQVDNLFLHIFSSINHLIRKKDYAGYLEIIEESRGYDWIEIETRHLPLHEVVYNLSKNDINIWAAGWSPFISVSGSIRQYIAAKRPIIAFDNIMISDIRGLLSIVPPHDTHGLVRAILNLCPNTERIEQYLKSHTWDIIRTVYD